jgi:hypothetical protein
MSYKPTPITARILKTTKGGVTQPILNMGADVTGSGLKMTAPSPNKQVGTVIYQGAKQAIKRSLPSVKKYATEIVKKASKAKFCKLAEFGKSLPKIQSDINKYIMSTRVTQNKIIALILQIIWICGFRVGNLKYQQLYESHGISNIFKSHITFNENGAIIEFKGKKSVINKCCIT